MVTNHVETGLARLSTFVGLFLFAHSQKNWRQLFRIAKYKIGPFLIFLWTVQKSLLLVVVHARQLQNRINFYERHSVESNWTFRSPKQVPLIFVWKNKKSKTSPLGQNLSPLIFVWKKLKQKHSRCDKFKSPNFCVKKIKTKAFQLLHSVPLILQWKNKKQKPSSCYIRSP